MTKHFDWRENQPIPGVAINPGTGPVHGATREHALANVQAFVADVLAGYEPIAHIGVTDTGELYDAGRYTFHLQYGKRICSLAMPGIPLEYVRWIKGETQGDIFDFPRVYVDESSWIWDIGVNVARDALFGPDEEAQ